MRRVLRNNGLSIVLLFLFLIFWLGQALAGWHVFNDDEIEHAGQALSFGAYLLTPHFLEATSENWESEFLQMAAYVALTAILFQKGSAESKDPDKPHASDRDIPNPLPAHAPKGLRHPHPLRRWLYTYSLSLTFAALFITSLIVHAISGHALHNKEELAHGRAAQTLLDYVGGSQFWFEAMQNWQSEFLAVLSIAILSIFLRHKGSPESKPVDMPNGENQD